MKRKLKFKDIVGIPAIRLVETQNLYGNKRLFLIRGYGESFFCGRKYIILQQLGCAKVDGSVSYGDGRLVFPDEIKVYKEDWDDYDFKVVYYREKWPEGE